MHPFIELVAASTLKSVSYEQYQLTPEDILHKMARANRRTTITLSPESHDIRVSKLAGRGTYTNEQLEAWIERALEIGIHQIDIWYFIGMPEQDEVSVLKTVEYAQRLLEKFQHARVNPMICPMIPFLDPGSNFFEEPDKYGYRVFHRTAEEHRRAMSKASIINQINYETHWLNRSELVRVSFQAIKHLMEAKASTGFLPDLTVKNYVSLIEDALDFIGVVHEVDNIPDSRKRATELESLGAEIQHRNDRVFFSGVSNQAFPVNRQIGGRWFDELGWDAKVLDAFQAASKL
jgi:clorobiocin biosynthesis protein CloN6